MSSHAESSRARHESQGDSSMPVGRLVTNSLVLATGAALVSWIAGVTGREATEMTKDQTGVRSSSRPDVSGVDNSALLKSEIVRRLHALVAEWEMKVKGVDTPEKAKLETELKGIKDAGQGMLLALEGASLSSFFSGIEERDSGSRTLVSGTLPHEVSSAERMAEEVAIAKGRLNEGDLETLVTTFDQPQIAKTFGDLRHRVETLNRQVETVVKELNAREKGTPLIEYSTTQNTGMKLE